MKLASPILRIVAAALAFFALVGLAAWLALRPRPGTPSPVPGPATPPETAPGTGVAVVYEDAGPEAKFAHSRARAASRALARAGVSVAFLPMASLDEALAPPCAVAHLVRPTEPAPERLATLRAFLARGGKLIVHASESPSLAALFALRPPMLPGVRAPGGGDWTHFAFEGAAPPLAPAVVPQRAPSIVMLRPANASARVLARWGVATNTPVASAPPALIRASAGFWLSRPLYDDLSADDAAGLLLSLTAALAPSVWDEAEESLRTRFAARRGPHPARTEADFLARAPKDSRERLQALFDDIAAAETARASATARRAPVDAIEALRAADRAWTLADAIAAPLGPLRGTRRLAVWAKGGWPPGTNTWDSAAAALAAAGVSDVYLYAGTLSGSIPAVPGVPAHPGRRFRGDPFPAAVAACHERGIRVHAWIFALQADLADGARYADPALTRRLLHTPDRSRRLPWLDPAVRTNATDLCAFVRALATRTGVDGVSLDYFRYPEEPTHEKRSPATLRALLSRVRADLRRAAPRCELSVCVYAFGGKVAQEWDGWLDAPLATFALPMNYAPDVATLRSLMARHPRHRDRQLCGIGAASNEALLSPGDLLAQLRAAYEVGYAGAAVYPFDERFLADYAPVLRAAR